MSKIINKKQLDFLIESTMKEAGMKMEADTCNECGGMMYEGLCEAGCGSQMEEGDYMEEEDGVSYDKSGLEHPEKADLNKDKKISGYEKKRGGAIEKSMKESDYVGESVKDLAESVTKTFNPSFLTEDMDNFKKLINYRNK